MGESRPSDPIRTLARALTHAWGEDFLAEQLEDRLRRPEAQAALVTYAARHAATHAIPDKGNVLFVLTIPSGIDPVAYRYVAQQLTTAAETVASGRASTVAVMDGYRLEMLTDDALAQLGLRRTDGEAECAAALREASAQLDTALERHTATRDGQHV